MKKHFPVYIPFLIFLIGTVACNLAKGNCNFLKNNSKYNGGIEVNRKKRLTTKAHLTKSTFTTITDERLLIQNVPQGKPSQILKREGYIVSYNYETHIPNWVAWHLKAQHTTGPYKREGIGFQEDIEAKGVRVTTFDYSRSGYDRGHMCPSADNKWSRRAQEQSFLLTNVCPQDHGLNVGDWNEMEKQCRKWAKVYGSIYIVSGPILYHQKHKTIGKSKVVVPDAFFKVILCMEGTIKAIGFIYKNKSGNRPKGDYVNSVDQIERITGIDFFSSLPDTIETRIEAKTGLFPNRSAKS